eukprot:CAMPEP_0172548288 /NCGR_PEP_ID=MMETSP1067-20121228/17618_1 /TAXON_ID=265564 ORGANISM="Thalassiosira punctigera, Strain Tpunct2005C2" /NCGR_SAMPLE_ID=MMETSP1067 /ASSEMBLY_ACC=CAM_ASM_000444 /LENGTH=403 /DNA_ID=CAMNT_0013335489 /DNA_START=73 /DNA_END=1281 /DNA_ORIENTATION=+
MSYCSSKGRGRLSLARAEKLGIRTSQFGSWSRSHSFNFAVRASVALIIIIITHALVSFSIIFSQIDFRRMSQVRYSSSSPRPAISPDIICSSRQQPQWRDEIDRHFNETTGRKPSFAVMLTLNDGFWDLFENWHNYFRDRLVDRPDKSLLILIAEDSIIYEKLKAMPESKKESFIVLPGHNFSIHSASDKAEDYESYAYKSLVSSRATYLLNLMCSFEGGESNNAVNEVSVAEGETKISKEGLVVVYSDVDTVWLKDPFPQIHAELYGTNLNDTQHPNYDILAAVDDHDYYGVDNVYCTGYLVIAQTPASFAFLSYWERELLSSPQLNQPIFNTLLRSEELPYIRHGGLGEIEFPPGRLYFDEWVKEGGELERLKKEKTLVVHNNYIIGHDAKIQRFQEHGLW